jgi:hypothetical protein
MARGIIPHPSASNLLIDPFADQGGLTKAGRGGDGRQLVTQLLALVEPVDQARPVKKLRPHSGIYSFVCKTIPDTPILH